MGEILTWLGVALLGALPVQSYEPFQPGPQLTIVEFAPLADPDVTARELCLLHGCTLHHVYRHLPGMAISGGNQAAIARSSIVLEMTPDQPVRIEADPRKLIGAPGYAPLAVVGGGLNAIRLPVERRWSYGASEDWTVAMDATTVLVENLARRQPNREFWSFQVLQSDGRGKLSDLIAAMEEIIGLRYAVGAVFIPLQIEGPPPGMLCRMIDEGLRKGLLVITDVDEGCPQN
jgi:hypothetical protein